MEEFIKVPASELKELSMAALKRVGVPQEDAELTAEVLVTADLQGIDTHGTRRLVPYIERIRRGLINPKANVKFYSENQAATLMDGDNGLGQVVAGKALIKAINISKKTGVSYVGCYNSNHFGPVAPYALKACKSEMICIIGTNAFPSIAAWGGRDIVVGNNPIGIGIPRQNNRHFILDMAMSIVARGRIRKAAEKGEQIPIGWALDKDGNPTTDPVEALKGFVLPIGGHKGYGLALAVDVLSGVLTGAGFGTGIKSLFQQMEEPQHIGHFFIIINPSKLIGLKDFYSRMETYCQMIKASRPINADNPVLIPGEIEAMEYEKRMVDGVPCRKDIYETIVDLSNGIYKHNIPKM